MWSIHDAVIIGAAAFLLGLLVWRAWRILSPRRFSLDNSFLFFALVFTAMLALRWAKICYGNEINQDESQMLAQAMRFLGHPVPWRDVDGTTSGPLNSLLLSDVMWFGAPPSWETARLVLFAANCCVAIFVYLSLRRILKAPEAQFVVMPLVLFYGFADSMDFTHYSSEALPTVLISACFYLLTVQWMRPEISKRVMFLLGFVLGAIPFAKLQAAPLAGFLGVTAVVLIFAKRKGSNKSRAKELTSLVAGTIVIPAIILCVVTANGAFNDFWKSYILSSGKYAGTGYVLPSGKFATSPWLVKRVVYVAYILLSPHNLGLFFLSGLGALAILVAISRTKGFSPAHEIRWPLRVVIAYAALAILCFFTAGKPFAHYGSLMIPALGLAIGLAFFAGKAKIETSQPTGSNPPSRPVWLILFTIIVLGLPGYPGLMTIYRAVRWGAPGSGGSTPEWKALVRSASKPGDTLSVWGWMPECYVRAGLPPATRDAVGHYVVSKGPYQEYYRTRHLQDLERSRPAVFIDAVSDGAFLCWDQWTASDRHESFPELARYIADNYALAGSFNMGSTSNVGPLRVYVLKSRLREMALNEAKADARFGPPSPWLESEASTAPTRFHSILIIGAAIFLFALAVWRWRRLLRPQSSKLDHPAVFFGLVFLAMLVLRWMSITFPAERNMDESQMVAQGMRFLSHSVPWRDVDGTTSGPWNSLLLTVPFTFGASPTWETARLMLLAANCAVIILIYLSLRFFLSRPEAQFTLMPLIFFYAFTSNWDYTHYSSETLSSVLLAAACYLLAKQWRGGEGLKFGIFLLGLVLGAVPFAKLQAAPLAGFLGVTSLALSIMQQRKEGASRGNGFGQIAALILGAALVPALILGTVAAKGALHDFWMSYILATRKDASTEHVLSSKALQGMPWWVKRIMYIAYILLHPLNLGLYFITGLGALVVLWGIWRAKKAPFPTQVRGPILFAVVYGCVAVVCIFTAGKPFVHYGIFMILPLAGVIGLVLLAGKSVLGVGGKSWFRRHWLMVFAAVAIIPQLGLAPLRIYQRVTARDGDPDWWAPSVYKYALPATQPGDALSVWGWMPELYVQLGLPPATRDAVSHYAVSSFYQEYYRQRYLDDLESAKPAIFIDAVGDGGFPAYSQWTTAQKHESFPALSQFIDENYSLFASVQLRPQVEVGPIRIYVLKKRLAKLHLSTAELTAPSILDLPPDSLPGWHSKRELK